MLIKNLPERVREFALSVMQKLEKWKNTSPHSLKNIDLVAAFEWCGEGIIPDNGYAWSETNIGNFTEVLVYLDKIEAETPKKYRVFSTYNELFAETLKEGDFIRWADRSTGEVVMQKLSSLDAAIKATEILESTLIGLTSVNIRPILENLKRRVLLIFAVHETNSITRQVFRNRFNPVWATPENYDAVIRALRNGAMDSLVRDLLESKPPEPAAREARTFSTFSELSGNTLQVGDTVVWGNNILPKGAVNSFYLAGIDSEILDLNLNGSVIKALTATTGVEGIMETRTRQVLLLFALRKCGDATLNNFRNYIREDYAIPANYDAVIQNIGKSCVTNVGDYTKKKDLISKQLNNNNNGNENSSKEQQNECGRTGSEGKAIEIPRFAITIPSRSGHGGNSVQGSRGFPIVVRRYLSDQKRLDDSKFRVVQGRS